MRFITRLCAVASLILATGCGNDSDGGADVRVETTGAPSSSAPPPNNGIPGGNTAVPGGSSGKSLFSVWNNGFYIFDLRAATLGAPSVAPIQFQGLTCACTIQLNGTAANGTVNLSNCMNTNRDAACTAYGYNGTYFFNANGELMVCNVVGQCSAFR